MNKTYYVCKYTPIELLEAFGGECQNLNEMPQGFDHADQIAHPNICGFGKALLEAVMSGKVKELVLVNCCDTIRSVYDILEDSGKLDFLYMIAGLPYRWVIIPIGMLIGYFIVKAEPAVYVLMEQVEELTSGAIPGKAMGYSLSLGVAFSLGLAMIRVLTGISILWFLVPGYALALILTLFVPKIFTAIAFDSGGVASGPMTATFLLPFAQGACEAVGGNVVTDAFGVVAMVAMTPLITIQILGVVYQYQERKKDKEEMLAQPVKVLPLEAYGDADIIEL